MHSFAPAALLVAAGFAAAQDASVTLTEVEIVPESTQTVLVPISEDVVEPTSTTTVIGVIETLTSSEGVETTSVYVVPEPESTETEVITAIPTETTSWIRYWPDIESSTLITTTFYKSSPNATGVDEPAPTGAVPAGVSQLQVGSSLAAVVGLAAGLLLL